ncbi:uncharacterized protein ACOB8E_017764 [Sarcophilus harrisii]
MVKILLFSPPNPVPLSSSFEGNYTAISEVEIHTEREEHSQTNEPNITLNESCNENINPDKTKKSIPQIQVSTGFTICTRNCLAELLIQRENEMKQEKLERSRALQQRAEQYRIFLESYAEGGMENITKDEENEKNDGTMRNLEQDQDVRLESKDDSNSERDNGTATTSASSRARFPRWMPSFFRTRGNSIRKKTTQTKKTPKVPTNYSCNYISQEKISEKVEERNTNQENFPKCQPETSHNMVNRGAMKTITKQEINDKYDGTMRNLDQEEDLGHESQDDSNTENDNETATTSHRAQEKKFTGWIPSFLGTLRKRIRKGTKEIKKTPKHLDVKNRTYQKMQKEITKLKGDPERDNEN